VQHTPLNGSTPAGRLLKVSEAEALLNVAPGFLVKDRARGPRIPFVKVGKRAIRYRRADIESFIANGLRVS
jgi:hypothetical protein